MIAKRGVITMKKEKTTSKNLYQAVKEVIYKLMDERDRKRVEIAGDSSLIEDLGLTSLHFVDLTVALEKALNIERFPIQQWIDQERRRSDKRFTFDSLVNKCVESTRKSRQL